jgi:hypothetical protein
MKSLALAIAVLVGAISALAANSAAAALERAAPLRSGNPAVLALLQTAQQELHAGRPQQASTFLERALQLEPRNPTVWHYLGVTRLDLGNYAQAEAMAAKSHSLAGNDRALRVSNAELLATALQSSGRAPTDAERQVLAAPSTFDTAIERARQYVGAPFEPRERRENAERPRGRSPAAVAQSWRDAQSAAWRRTQAAAQQAEAAAQRAEAAARRAEAEIYRRTYRYESNEIRRRRR